MPKCREHAEAGIVKFLRSGRRMLLLTGTHQQKKHELALLKVLAEYTSPATILFRTNHSSHFVDFLSSVIALKARPRRGAAIRVPPHHLFVDTMNTRSWCSSPKRIDAAIVYPIDSLGTSGPRCVQDLLDRDAQKILLINWTGTQDISWVRAFEPIEVVYDAKTEHPAYHQEVIACCVTALLGPQLKSLALVLGANESKLFTRVSQACAASD